MNPNLSQDHQSVEILTGGYVYNRKFLTLSNIVLPPSVPQSRLSPVVTAAVRNFGNPSINIQTNE